MEITINISVEELKELMNLHSTPAKVQKKKETHVSCYAAFFDEASTCWTNNSERNRMFLHQQQHYANDRLRAKGHLFLNEVFDMLGLPRTSRGKVVGWVYKPDNPVGDNYVDFGLYSSRNHDFINGYEKTVLLDFNVDGDILSYL